MYADGYTRVTQDWAQISPNLKEINPADMPIGLVLSGVNGANGCKYTANLMDTLSEIGFRPVLLHYLNFKFTQPDDDVNGFVPIEVGFCLRRNTASWTILLQTI